MGNLEGLQLLVTDTNAILVFVVALIISAWLLMSRRNLPPGPWGNLLLGQILDIQRSTDYHLTLLEYRRRFGDIFRLRFGFTQVIVLNSPEVVREALIEKSQFFSERPDWIRLVNKVVKGQGIVFNKNWQFTKRFAMSTMRDFGVGKSPIEGKCQEELEVLSEEFRKHDGKPFNCQQLMQNAISNIICGVIFNRRFDYDDKDFQIIIQSLNTNVKSNPLYTVANYVPFLLEMVMMVNTGLNAMLVANFERMWVFVRRMVDQHRLTFDAENIRDFTDLYLLSQTEGAESKVTEEDAFRMILDMFLAGTETTATTLQWIFIYMMYNPEVQEKCREEINKVIGSSRAPVYADHASLPYTEATLLEVQRMATVAPWSVPHTTTQETTLGTYTIPKDVFVILNIYSCHRDHKSWGDPDNFRPERWIDEDGKLRKFAAFMPFSLGKRACAGEALARMEIFMFAVAFLQRFRFKMAATPPSMLGHLGVTLQPQPFEMIAEPVT